MPNKISKIEQNYEAIDFTELVDDLKLADYEEMNNAEFALAKYKETGVRPLRIAKADAEKFGLRKAFWDVYSPIEKTETGQWTLEVNEAGEESIIRTVEASE